MSDLNESTIRSAAARQGYRITKSRTAEHLNNLGGYMIVDRDRNWVVAGERYDLTLDDVAAWLEHEKEA
jgi:hypothetical protein